MNISQMRKFKAIAKHESISKAAEELFISPPALSRVLSSLEKELNHKLFDRKKGKIYLNEQGEFFLESVNRILDIYGEIFQYFDSLNKDSDEPLVICELTENVMDKLINSFIQKYPFIRLERRYAPYDKALEMLINHQADIIFADKENLNNYEDLFHSQHITATFLIKNFMFVGVPLKSSYTKYKSIDLNKIKNEAFIMPDINENININYINFVKTICKKEKITLNIKKLIKDPIAFTRTAYFEPTLYLSDSVHLGFYYKNRKYKKYIKLSNENACQDIYLCYRNNDKRIVMIAEYIQKYFFDVFKNDDLY